MVSTVWFLTADQVKCYVSTCYWLLPKSTIQLTFKFLDYVIWKQRNWSETGCDFFMFLRPPLSASKYWISIYFRWTADGRAVAVSWERGGVSIWSTFGALLMCTLAWDYGLNQDLSKLNPLVVSSLVSTTHFKSIVDIFILINSAMQFFFWSQNIFFSTCRLCYIWGWNSWRSMTEAISNFIYFCVWRNGQQKAISFGWWKWKEMLVPI